MAAAVAEGAVGSVGCFGSMLSSWRYLPPTVGVVASVALPIIIGISAGVGSALYAGVAFGGAGFVASCFGFDAAYKANTIAALKAAEAAAKKAQADALVEVTTSKAAAEASETSAALAKAAAEASQAEVDKLKGDLDALKSEEAQLETDEGVLKKENADLKQQVDALGAQITALQQENQTMKATLDKLTAVRDTLMQENQVMKADIEQLTAMKTKLEGDVQDLTKVKDDLTNANQILQGDLDDFSKKNKELGDLLSRYNTKLGASTTVVEQAAELLKKEGANLDQLAPQLIAAAAAAADLKNTLVATKIADVQRQAQYAALEKDEETLKAQVDQLTGVKTQLEEDEKSLRTQIEALRAQVAAETKEHADFMQRLKAEMAVVQDRLDQKKSGQASAAASPATARKVLPQPPAAKSEEHPNEEAHAESMV